MTTISNIAISCNNKNKHDKHNSIIIINNNIQLSTAGLGHQNRFGVPMALAPQRVVVIIIMIIILMILIIAIYKK